MKKEVFKIQKPLSTNMEVPQALIYNEKRTIEFMLPFIQVKKYFTNELKIYVYGYLEGKTFQITGKTLQRNW